MRALRYASLLGLASCGGFLPFFGGDDDDPPPPDPSADATTAEGSSDPNDPANDSSASFDGLAVGDGQVTLDGPVNGCKNAPGACTQSSQCCGQSECRAQKCCILDGPTNNVALCCSGEAKACTLPLGGPCCTPDK